MISFFVLGKKSSTPTLKILDNLNKTSWLACLSPFSYLLTVCLVVSSISANPSWLIPLAFLNAFILPPIYFFKSIVFHSLLYIAYTKVTSLANKYNKCYNNACNVTVMVIYYK